MVTVASWHLRDLDLDGRQFEEVRGKASRLPSALSTSAACGSPTRSAKAQIQPTANGTLADSCEMICALEA